MKENEISNAPGGTPDGTPDGMLQKHIGCIIRQNGFPCVKWSENGSEVYLKMSEGMARPMKLSSKGWVAFSPTKYIRLKNVLSLSEQF